MPGRKQPYHRTIRQFSDGTYGDGGLAQYIRHKAFAKDPDMFVRAFLLLQKDLIGIFDYVEPCNENKDCYSHRIHEIIIRAAIEIEANCKAILLENCYPQRFNSRGESKWNINDYVKISDTHRLPSYRVEVPYWRGDKTKRPFAGWEPNKAPDWYRAYNATKHDRHESFKRATLNNAVYAVSALAVLLTAQFRTEDFAPGPDIVALRSAHPEGFEPCIGGFFAVRFPRDWPADERYDFTFEEWAAMESQDDPFQNLTF